MWRTSAESERHTHQCGGLQPIVSVPHQRRTDSEATIIGPKIRSGLRMPHAVMGCKLPRVTLVFCLLFHTFPGASSAITFETSPALTGRHVGDDVTMEWTLSSDPEEFSQSAFFNENGVSIIRRIHGGTDTIGPGYESRVSFYNTSSRGVGFRLTDVRLSDAERYRCRYEYTGPIDSSLSLLFVFGEPSTPVISLKRYGQISDPFTGDLEEGDSVTLLCAASSTSLPAADRPAMTYTWTRNGQPIDRDNPPDRHSVTHATGRRLDISPVHRSDVTYRCTAQEEGSILNSQTTRDLDVLYPPGDATAPDPPPSPVVQGAPLTVTCSLADPGNPPARVVYRSPKGQHHTPSNNGLVISAVTLDRDDGTWACYGTNTAGTAREATFDITLHVPPRVNQNLPATKTVDITQTLSVWCSFEGRPAPVIQWTYGGSAVLPVAVETVSGEATGDKLVTSSSTLRWKALSANAQRRLAGGVYRCTATNAAATVTSRDMTLNAQYAPNSVTVTPSRQVTTVEGERLELEGSADCNPPCQYSWTLDGVSLTQDTSGRLQIDSISRDKHGTYALRVYNDLGGLTENAVVNVNYPPIVTMTIDPEDGSQGDRVEIKCEVDSRPPSQVTWTNVTGSGIPRGTVSAGLRQPTNTLDPADCLDSGTIRCTADNGITPTASDQRELNVFCPPRLDFARTLIDRHGVLLGGNATFLVYVIANPASATWTYTLTTENGSTHNNNVNGVTLSPSGNPGTLTIASVQPHHYGDYDVTVTNTKGQPLVIQLKLQTKGPPESPEEFKLNDVTCASVTLQWEAGFNGGSPQTFHLSYRRSGATEWRTETVEDSGQDIISHKVNNLQEQTVYEFKLFAKNADGSTEDKALRSTAETTACLKFVPDSLEISIQDNIATISWQFTQRVDRVDVTCCNDPSVCTKRRVDQPTAQQPITMEVPPGSQNYIFTFTLFQDGELVFSSEITHYPASGNNAAIIAAVTTTVIVVIIVIVVVIVVIVLRRKRRVSKRDATPLYENTAYQNDRSATDAVQHKSTETGAATEFEASQVEIQTLLSDGTGFQVHSAQVQIGLSLHAAVIKRVKDAASLEVYSRYLADQMSVLLSLKHVNVVKLLGFQRGCGGEYENEASMSSLSLVLEPATQGDLHTFLTGHGAGVYQKTVTMETMMGMALGVATGAHALSDNKPAALHHYVCAKHVLVDDRGVCKLTGFSTAEAVRAREEWEAIHKSERLVRWMSAETLNHLEHTTKSDVWSFAIFLWELFSLGEMPYPELEDDEVQTAIQDGNRLEKPNNCDPTTYDLMAECWIRNTERRPGFQYVMNCLMKYQSEKTNASADEHTYEAVV